MTKLFCKLFGHEWRDLHLVSGFDKISEYCRTCGARR